MLHAHRGQMLMATRPAPGPQTQPVHRCRQSPLDPAASTCLQQHRRSWTMRWCYWMPAQEPTGARGALACSLAQPGQHA